MFGAVILAELPDSLRAHSPNESRYIEASYIHCGIHKGPIVSGRIRVDGELELRRFVARNVRVVTPLAWKLELCDDLLSGFGGDGVDGNRAVGDRLRDVAVAPADVTPDRHASVENVPDGDQTHLGHHKPTHLGHHRQETHLEHHISTHLGHHRQHFCERVVTGGHSLRSPTQTYYIPLGLDMGAWGLGDMGRDMGTWGLGDMVLLDHIPKQTTHL